MTLSTSIKQTRIDYLLRIMLTAVLVFAAWHVATHDIDISGDLNIDEHCQVCRLTHVPTTDLPILAWILPVFIISIVRLVSALQPSTPLYRNSFRARAPPLF